MGRIIRGAPTPPGSYRLAIPQPVRAGDATPHSGGVDDVFGFDGAATTFEPAPAARGVDLERVEREATALIDSAAHEAQRILDDAHARANALVDDAAARGEAIMRDAELSGHNRGYEAGSSAAQREMDEMLETMRGLVEMARLERHKIIEDAEPEIVRLSVGIAERVLHQHIALDRDAVVEMVKVAISRIVDRETITVRVNPADIERMREHRDAMLELGDVTAMRVIEDQRVDRGGVVLETEAGTIDAKISTQLTEVKRVLQLDDDVQIAPVKSPTVTLVPALAS